MKYDLPDDYFPEPNTVQIRKDLITDKRLSFYDKGVYCFLWVNAGNPKHLGSFRPKEVRKFAASVRLLIKLGYIQWGEK